MKITRINSFVGILLLGFGTAAGAQTWTQVTSPHFTVITDGGARPARHLAGQLERVRLVFQAVFPGLQADPDMPVEVLALNDASELKPIEPTAYLGRGKLQIGGIFFRGPLRNYIVVELDAGENQYQSIYHEYAHVLSAKEAESIPLWLAEGIAQYFQTTQIAGDQVKIGLPVDGALALLRQYPLLPLPVLFKVDASSPYYHEEDQGNMFYAQSWMLVHYLMTLQANQHRDLLNPYLALVAQGVDPVTAATQTFGDLDKLQNNLDLYVHNLGLQFFHFKLSTDIQEQAFPEQVLPPGTGDAVRAKYMLLSQRVDEAATLLKKVLQQNPNNAVAIEALGDAQQAQGQKLQALGSYRQAVQLAPRDARAQYLYGTLLMAASPHPLDDATAAQVEASMHAAIQANPQFAPAYDGLAQAEASNKANLAQARLDELQAIEIDPGDLNFRIDMSNIFIDMDNLASAAQVLQQALRLAITPDAISVCRHDLNQVQQEIAAQAPPQAPPQTPPPL